MARLFSAVALPESETQLACVFAATPFRKQPLIKFSLCLSRACLGEIISFGIKVVAKAVSYLELYAHAGRHAAAVREVDELNDEVVVGCDRGRHGDLGWLGHLATLLLHYCHWQRGVAPVAAEQILHPVGGCPDDL